MGNWLSGGPKPGEKRKRSDYEYDTDEEPPTPSPEELEKLPHQNSNANFHPEVIKEDKKIFRASTKELLVTEQENFAESSDAEARSDITSESEEGHSPEGSPEPAMKRRRMVQDPSESSAAQTMGFGDEDACYSDSRPTEPFVPDPSLDGESLTATMQTRTQDDDDSDGLEVTGHQKHVVQTLDDDSDGAEIIESSPAQLPVGHRGHHGQSEVVQKLSDRAGSSPTSIGNYKAPDHDVDGEKAWAGAAAAQGANWGVAASSAYGYATSASASAGAYGQQNAWGGTAGANGQDWYGGAWDQSGSGAQYASPAPGSRSQSRHSQDARGRHSYP